MKDEANVPADARGPEVFVFGFVEFVELRSGVGGVELEVEGGGFDELLLVVGEPGEAGGEGVGDAEVQRGLPKMCSIGDRRLVEYCIEYERLWER